MVLKMIKTTMFVKRGDDLSQFVWMLDNFPLTE